MMYKRLVFFFLSTAVIGALYAAPDPDAFTINKVISQLHGHTAPFVRDTYAVFTAAGEWRWVGVAFEHEDYRTIHPFKRIVMRDENGAPVQDKDGAAGNYLFFVANIPEKTNKLRYRLVIDGLWTTDPLNPQKEKDPATGIMTSLLDVPYYETARTAFSAEGTAFVYKDEGGQSGLAISVCGTFNNWDPFMYELAETEPGVYELNLPLPSGVYYYAFVRGANYTLDPANPDRAYTKDGRAASVLVVP